MARAVQWVWVEAGDAPDIIVSGRLKVEFSTRDVVKARHLIEELCQFLGDRLGSCQITKLEG